MVWHCIGLLVTQPLRLCMKKPAVRVLFMYFVALAVFESVAGIKERKKLRFRDPVNFLSPLHLFSILQCGHFPAFER